jgi:signal transduction histidine kinase
MRRPLARAAVFRYHMAMSDFARGLLAGWVIAAPLAVAVAWLLFRRGQRYQARAKDAERLAELGTLTGGLAHEIKNPLSTVQLNLQLLLEDLRPGDPATSRLRHRLDTAERETARLREILDDFLRYAGRMELELKPVELNSLCEDLVDFFLPQAQLQRVQLRLKRWHQELRVEADERLLKQAILNLMLNAVQAMPSGGELILAVSATSTEAAIDVTDTGCGIPPEDLDKIFRAYYSKRRGGTGLGLAMTRRIIEEHGGRITVTSQVGKGTNFSVRLPLKR